MSQRITIKDLKILVKHLNKITGSPLEPYTKDADGKFRANIGCFLLDQAYGGVKLSRIHCEAGSEDDVLSTGYVKARDLFGRIDAYIRGIELIQENESC